MGTPGIRSDDGFLVSSHLPSMSIDLRPFEGCSRRLGRWEVAVHSFVVHSNCTGKKSHQKNLF